MQCSQTGIHNPDIVSSEFHLLSLILPIDVERDLIPSGDSLNIDSSSLSCSDTRVGADRLKHLPSLISFASGVFISVATPPTDNERLSLPCG